MKTPLSISDLNEMVRENPEYVLVFAHFPGGFGYRIYTKDAKKLSQGEIRALYWKTMESRRGLTL